MQQKKALLPNIWSRLKRLWKGDIKVYFVSGMCYNCKVFNSLTLPKGYKKVYIEWRNPHIDETLNEYAQAMAANVDTKKPFILIGYSFGGVIIQEMNKFLKPQKNIIISSFKNKNEIPPIFRFARATHIVERASIKIFESTQYITDIFNRYVYDMDSSELAEYMTCVDPVYIKWSVTQIVSWAPESECSHLYHIHGTKDQIFPPELIKNSYKIKDGDHLMVMKRAYLVSQIIERILSKEEVDL